MKQEYCTGYSSVRYQNEKQSLNIFITFFDLYTTRFRYLSKNSFNSSIYISVFVTLMHEVHFYHLNLLQLFKILMDIYVYTITRKI